MAEELQVDRSRHAAPAKPPARHLRELKYVANEIFRGITSWSASITKLLDKAVAGERLTPDEGLRLLESRDLTALGRAADAVTRRLHPEPYRTYNIDRNINYTNVCSAVCDFCAFSRKPKDPEGYVLDRDEVLYRRSKRRSIWAATRSSCKGACIPSLPIEWYEELLRDIKRALSAGQHSRLQPAGNSRSRPRSPSCRCGRCSSG